MQIDVHECAHAKGWWKEKVQLEDQGPYALATSQLAGLALVHSEISEAVEAIRAGNPPDDKIPEFSGAEAECADAVIRLMDLAERYDWRLAEAIAAKSQYNITRLHKHGGKVL